MHDLGRHTYSSDTLVPRLTRDTREFQVRDELHGRRCTAHHSPDRAKRRRHISRRGGQQDRTSTARGYTRRSQYVKIVGESYLVTGMGGNLILILQSSFTYDSRNDLQIACRQCVYKSIIIPLWCLSFIHTWHIY